MSDYEKTLEQFEKLAQELFIQENKTYIAGLLLPRFKQAADKYRHDTTINQAAFVLEQLVAQDPNRQITAQDLKDLENQFYTSSSSFSSEFADLLEEQTLKTNSDSGRLDFSGGIKNIEWDGAHEASSNDLYSEQPQLDQLVDPTVSLHPQELQFVQHAAQLIDDELRRVGSISKVSSVLKVKTPGQYIFQTIFRTASSEGDLDVIIPIEIAGETPLFPQVMSTTERVYTLDSEGLQDLTADTNAQIQLKRAQSVNNLRSPEDYEIALRNDSMGKYSEEVDEYTVPEPKQVSLGDQEIEKILQDAVLATDSDYSEQTRSQGRDLVETELTDLGFHNSQVSFNGDYEHGLTYEASVNTGRGKLKIVVAIENNKGLLLPPSQFRAANQIHTLTKHAIEQVANGTQLDHQPHPYLFAMSYPDLKKQLKTAAHQKQHKLAQDIINLIDEKFGEHYRNTATDDYQTWLEESITSYASRCGDCTYYIPKTAQANADRCDLIKTAAKNVKKDADTDICTRSTYADLEDTSVMFDNGQSIKISWDD